MKSLEILEIMIKHRNSYGITLCDIDQIKQDLEVLEIIKKYLYLANWNGFQSIEIDDLHSNIEDKKENFHKIKQWLEENE